MVRRTAPVVRPMVRAVLLTGLRRGPAGMVADTAEDMGAVTAGAGEAPARPAAGVRQALDLVTGPRSRAGSV
ncbi:exported protein of unknown function [Kyrpidia spormannii]|uniref:Uncharacterized protein n=1 Tax=Kyrpidia spormannii TaxID=2055160 RepID=A0ACA8ZA94_9BACL|nr:exported protein of unknown function [Kyrpidia spormannii]